MGSLADAAGKFAEKFADVLDVFDLSFFVAGSAALGAFLVWLGQQDVPVPDDFSTDRALVAVIIAYVLGLASFALGRAARETITPIIFPRPGSAHPLKRLYEEHNLGRVPDYSDYVDRWTALYSRLWVLVRTERSLRESYSLVRRYWVLGAAYDGLAMAALAWTLPVWGLEGTSPYMRVTLISALLAAALLSWRQAVQYHRYQVDELAATAAHWHHTRSTSDDATSEDDLGVDAED